MTFLYPQFLWALGALAIPVIIHLFYFRRYRTVYFTNVRHLKEIKEETATRSNLKQLLILLSRLLALALLVFAFAQPFIPNELENVKVKDQAVSIFVDNSFSMNAGGQAGSLLDESKKIVNGIVESYGAAHDYQLLTHDFKGEQQALINDRQINSFLEDVEITSGSRNLNDILLRQKQALEKSGAEEKISYIISDFQKSMVNTEALERDTNFNVFLIPLQSQQSNNIYIDSCWFDAPVLKINEPINMMVRLGQNDDESSENISLSLKVDGKIKAIADVNFEQRKKVTDTLRFTIDKPGWHTAEVLIDDYPISYDDNYFVSFQIVPSVAVLSINGTEPNKYLNAIFSSDDYFVYEEASIDQIDYASLPNFNTIVLNEITAFPSGLVAELKNFVLDGGSIVVIPPFDLDIESYNDALEAWDAGRVSGVSDQSTTVSRINIESNLFANTFEELPENIDLPVVNKHVNFSGGVRSREEQLLTFRNRQPFVSRFENEKGAVYMFGAPLDEEFTNLPAHAIFVPMFYNIALLSKSPEVNAYVIGKKDQIEIRNTGYDRESHFILKNENIELIPEQRYLGNKIVLNLHDRNSQKMQLQEAGIYELVNSKGVGEKKILAFNYNRNESILDYYTEDELEAVADSLGYHVLGGAGSSQADILKGISPGTSLWKLCIILALVFIAAEILLIKFWKV